MTYLFLAVGLLVWFTSGVLSHGLALSYYTEKYPTLDHRDVIRMSYLMGPFGLLSTLSLGQYNSGLRFVPYTTEERWVAFNQEYPSLGREHFDRTRS